MPRPNDHRNWHCAWGWKCEIALHISLSLTMSCKKSATPVDIGGRPRRMRKKSQWPIASWMMALRCLRIRFLFFQPTSWMTSVKTLLSTSKGEITCGNSRNETGVKVGYHSLQSIFLKKAKTFCMSSWVRKSLLLQVCICLVGPEHTLWPDCPFKGTTGHRTGPIRLLLIVPRCNSLTGLVNQTSLNVDKRCPIKK